MSHPELIQEFCNNAQTAGAKVFIPNSEQEIVDYVLTLARNAVNLNAAATAPNISSQAANMASSTTATNTSSTAANNISSQATAEVSSSAPNISSPATAKATSSTKVASLALPGLADFSPKLHQLLVQTAKEQNISYTEAGLREYLTGIPLALTPAQAGVAASGSCLVASGNDDVRLATMISEVSLLLLNPSTIMAQLPNLAPLLRQYQQQANYTALITGPSRTADIERVLAIGVHGPLELHIILWNHV